VTSQGIKLAEDVIEEQERVHPSTLVHEFVSSQTKSEGQGALLALGGLATSVSTLE
jgi:hypothetical protein